MLSTRELHRTALENRVQSFSKSGKALGHKLKPPSAPDPPETIDKLDSRNEAARDVLLNAVVAAQKSTIANFQKDHDELTRKIDSLKKKLTKAEEVARKQDDYDSIQASFRSEYEAGIEHGMTKVYRSIVTHIHSCTNY